MRQLAERVGCSHGNLYLHFKDKEALFDCLVEESFDQFARALRKQVEAAKSDDPVELVRKAGRAYVQFGVHDGEPDNGRFDQAELKRRETAYGGNYIVIDHGNGEYSWFGHLQQGSTRVKLGERVEQGQTIARLGASGDSLFPHLHYELRNGAGARGVEGLPSEFTHFQRLLGTTVITVERGAVTTGDIVQSQPQR